MLASLLAGVCFSLLAQRITWGARDNENPRGTQGESLGVGPRNYMQVPCAEEKALCMFASLLHGLASNTEPRNSVQQTLAGRVTSEKSYFKDRS